MTNEVEDVVDVPEFVPTADDEGNDTTDWKAEAEKQREFALKNQGIAKRYKTKSEKTKEPTATPDPKKPEKSGELDWGQKAYLVANGIKTSEETALVQEVMSATGKDLEAVLGSKHFQGSLKELREAQASSEAIPKGTKRSANTSVSDVDYWIAKDELPPDTAENRELRTKVVQEKYNREKSASPFKVGGNSITIK